MGTHERHVADDRTDRVVGSVYILGPDGTLTEGFFVMNDDGEWEPWRD